MERHHARTAAFTSVLGSTLEARTADAMSVKGMVGGPIVHIEDAIKLGSDIEWVRYETFAADPAATLARVAKALDLSDHDWDFEHVVNIAADVDAIHRHKFPHDGSGAIRPATSTWRDVIDANTAARIAASYPLFLQRFGYQETP